MKKRRVKKGKVMKKRRVERKGLRNPDMSSTQQGEGIQGEGVCTNSKVSKVKGYREKVFALILSLKYLDGMDSESNDRLETNEEKDDYEEDE
ncbi:hypothetical protein ABZP36_030572 [Zizania latifolia]